MKNKWSGVTKIWKVEDEKKIRRTTSKKQCVQLVYPGFLLYSHLIPVHKQRPWDRNVFMKFSTDHFGKKTKKKTPKIIFYKKNSSQSVNSTCEYIFL